MRFACCLLLLGVLALPARADEPKTNVVKLDKLSSAAPAGWRSEKPQNRLRSYRDLTASF